MLTNSRALQIALSKAIIANRIILNEMHSVLPEATQECYEFKEFADKAFAIEVDYQNYFDLDEDDYDSLGLDKNKEALLMLSQAQFLLEHGDNEIVKRVFLDNPLFNNRNRIEIIVFLDSLLDEGAEKYPGTLLDAISEHKFLSGFSVEGDEPQIETDLKWLLAKRLPTWLNDSALLGAGNYIAHELAVKDIEVSIPCEMVFGASEHVVDEILSKLPDEGQDIIQQIAEYLLNPEDLEL